MHCTHRNLAALGWLLLLGTAGADAHAQLPTDATAQAQVLFQEGKAALDAGKYAEACPKLAESNRLDPAPGTQYRLAECYEKTGKLASAWSLYKDVETASRQSGKKDREAVARERAAAIEPLLPKVQVVVAPEAAKIDGLEVKRNDVPMGPASWGRSFPVDVGAQRIVATAPGKKTWEKTIDAVAGKTVEIKIERLEDPPISPVPAPAGATTTPPSPATTTTAKTGPADANAPLDARVTAAIALGATGVVGIGVGSGLGLAAKSKWDDAKSTCQLDDAGKPELSSCPASKQTANDAEAMAHGATAGFVVGGVSLGVAGILLLLPKLGKSAIQRTTWIAAPNVSREHVGLVVVGSF